MHRYRNLIFSFFCLLLELIAFNTYARPDFGPVDMEEFYSSLPDISAQDKLGKLIKAERIKTTSAGVQAWKIAYVSSDVNEHKTLVTGILVAPLGNNDSKKNRPIMAWAHGTTGTAQNCGPSQPLNPAQPLNQYLLMNGNSWTDFGLPAMEAFIKADYVIVATDYQGLGGGGRHQYAVAATQAQDVINSIKAATQLREAKAGNKAIIYGWSQGGGAALAAAGMQNYVTTQDSVNSQIKILGLIAMAPYDIGVVLPEQITTDQGALEYLKTMTTIFSMSVPNFTEYAQHLWGMAAAFPELKLDDVLTEEGAKVIDTLMGRKCLHSAMATLNFNYGDKYKSFLRSNIKNSYAWVEANKKGSVKSVTPLAPVIIYWGTDDTTVPPIMAELYFNQMCLNKGQVIRVRLHGNQNHFTTPRSAEPLYVAWIADRLAEKPIENVCSDLNA